MVGKNWDLLLKARRAETSVTRRTHPKTKARRAETSVTKRNIRKLKPVGQKHL